MQNAEQHPRTFHRRTSLVPWMAVAAVCSVLAISVVHVSAERSRVAALRSKADSAMRIIPSCRMGESIDEMNQKLKEADWFKTAEVKHYTTEGGHLRAISATWRQRSHLFRAWFLDGKLNQAMEMVTLQPDPHEEATFRMRVLSHYSPVHPCGYMTTGETITADPDLPCQGTGF